MPIRGGDMLFVPGPPYLHGPPGKKIRDCRRKSSYESTSQHEGQGISEDPFPLKTRIRGKTESLPHEESAQQIAETEDQGGKPGENYEGPHRGCHLIQAKEEGEPQGQ